MLANFATLIFELARIAFGTAAPLVNIAYKIYFPKVEGGQLRHQLVVPDTQVPNPVRLNQRLSIDLLLDTLQADIDNGRLSLEFV